MPQASVVYKAGKKKRQTYGGVNRSNETFGNWQMAENIAKGNHDNNQNIAFRILEGEKADLVLALSLGIYSRYIDGHQFRKPEIIYNKPNQNACDRQ